MCPDQSPITGGLGVRLNCEVGPGLSNLQTFLIVREDQGAQGASSLPPAHIPTPEAFGRPIREAMERLRNQ